MTQLPPPYPLAWPDDWKRTPSFKRSKSLYEVGFTKARDEVLAELRRFGAIKSVITTNMVLRLDGLPLSKQRDPEDPGVAVWWIDRRTNAVRVMACDQWRTARENMRAVGKAIEALRALERCGASQILERAAQSFNVPALPAPSGARPWWFERLKLQHWPPRHDDIAAAYRALAKVEHPDCGGTHDGFVELGKAWRDAEAWWSGAGTHA